MMMRLIKQFLSFCLSFVLIWGIIYGYSRLTDGFSVREIKSSLSSDLQEKSLSLSEDRQENLKKILSQSFRYIGKGCQFYVFESNDGQFVLKFFKHKHLRPMYWLREIPMPVKWHEKCEEKIYRREERVRFLFSSCKLAYEELSEETGVMYLHLNQEPTLSVETKIIDKLGLGHTIFLDDYEYVLQKKAIRVAPTLATLLEKHQNDALHTKIHELSLLVQKRCEKGICDRDRSFVQNVAFSAEENKAVFVDIGQFYKDEKIRSQEEMQADVLRRLGDMRYWAEQKFPALIPYVEAEIATIPKKSN